MTTYKISLSDEQADKLADYLSGDVAEQIRAQIPKPAIEEPTETFSVIKARDLMSGTTGLFWTRIRGGWIDDKEGVFRGWLNLEVYEVLRVGIGERQDVAPEDTEDYKAGVNDALALMRQKRAEALTAERQNAYDTAITLIGGLRR